MKAQFVITQARRCFNQALMNAWLTISKSKLIGSLVASGAAALLIFHPQLAKATLLVYEGFNYPVGSDPMTASASSAGDSFGWAGKWSTANSATIAIATNVAGSLGYADLYGHSLDTDGGSLIASGLYPGGTPIGGTDNSQRTRSFAIGTLGGLSNNIYSGLSSGTYWVSFTAQWIGPTNSPPPLYVKKGSVQFRIGAYTNGSALGVPNAETLVVGRPNANTNLNVGWSGLPYDTWTLWTGGDQGAQASAVPTTYPLHNPNGASFILLRLDVDGNTNTLDKAYLWVNCTNLAAMPDISTADATNAANLTGINNIRLDANGSGITVVQSNTVVHFDEFRLGTTFADVTPHAGGLPPILIAQPTGQTNVVGTTASFTIQTDSGDPVTYLWRKDSIALMDGNEIHGANTATLTLSNVQPANAGNYTVVVSNCFGAVTSLVAVLHVNQFPIADAGATVPLVISSCDSNATVVFDGSRSSDPDGDVLQYRWYAGDQLLATGVIAPVTLPVGIHPLRLVVDDGVLSATNSFTVEVLNAVEAVERLAAAISGDVDRAQPLVASLRAALASIDRSHPGSAINQLHAFQNQVRAQIAPLDAALADALIQQAQQIIDVLCAGLPRAHFTAVNRHGNGRVQLKFTGESGASYLLEASTNLVDWEAIGPAVPEADGGFGFEDADAAQQPQRFYRIIAR